jgi:hypothetical protein
MPTTAADTATPITRKKSVKKKVTVKQEIKKKPQEPSLPSLPSTPTQTVTILPKRSRTISSDITTPPRPLKQPITKKPIKQADSNVRTRKQKEEDGEPLLAGIDR